MSSPVSGLSLRDNLIVKALSRPEVMDYVIASDYGYNKVQRLVQLTNQNGTKKVAQTNFKIPKLGNTAISNIVNGASVLSGSNLVVSLTNADTRFRLKDLVADSNLVQGRVIAVTSTSITLEPWTVSSWNTATHFTAGMQISNLGDVSGLDRTTGKTSLNVTPEYDYALLAKSRETYSQGVRDKIKTEVKFNGKYWYASQQELLLKRYAMQMEYKYVFHERVEKTGTAIEGDANTTGGIRWTAKSNGGTYYPLTATMTEADLQDFLYEMSAKFAQAPRNIMLLCGKEAVFAIQNFLKDNIIYSGEWNTFGGKSVTGYNIFTYGIGGMTVNITEYPLFNDTTLFPAISTVTGKPKMQSTVMALELTPVDSANGSGTIPVIQKFSFEGMPEVAHRFVSGMNLWDSGNNSVEAADFTLAQSSIDASDWELYSFDGIYVIPEKVGWMEMTL